STCAPPSATAADSARRPPAPASRGPSACVRRVVRPPHVRSTVGGLAPCLPALGAALQVAVPAGVAPPQPAPVPPPQRPDDAAPVGVLRPLLPRETLLPLPALLVRAPGGEDLAALLPQPLEVRRERRLAHLPVGLHGPGDGVVLPGQGVRGGERDVVGRL